MKSVWTRLLLAATLSLLIEASFAAQQVYQQQHIQFSSPQHFPLKTLFSRANGTAPEISPPSSSDDESDSGEEVEELANLTYGDQGVQGLNRPCGWIDSEVGTPISKLFILPAGRWRISWRWISVPRAGTRTRVTIFGRSDEEQHLAYDYIAGANYPSTSFARVFQTAYIPGDRLPGLPHPNSYQVEVWEVPNNVRNQWTYADAQLVWWIDGAS